MKHSAHNLPEQRKKVKIGRIRDWRSNVPECFLVRAISLFQLIQRLFLKCSFHPMKYMKNIMLILSENGISPPNIS